MEPQHIEDAIARVRNGDADSYAEVVREYQARLRAFIASLCPDPNQVDEVAQRAFVWAYEHLADYEPQTRFYAWLKAVARNVLLSELETQKREAKRRQDYFQHLQVAASLEELARRAEGSVKDYADLLAECLDRLPSFTRSLAIEAHRHRGAMRELARKLNRNETALKVAVFRIRQGLRRCVEGKLAMAEAAAEGSHGS